MSQMTEEEFLNASFQKINPEPDRLTREKANTRIFWLSVVLGSLVGLVGMALTGAPIAFFPVAFVAGIFIYSGLEQK